MKTKKEMKKITNIGMAALVAMGVIGAACSKIESPEIETPETQKENIVTLTTTVGFAADDTKALTAEGVKTFAEGETMAIYYWKNKGDDHEKAVSAPLTAGDITNGGKSATFTFTLDNPYKDMSVSYVYPAAMAKADFTPNYDALYNNQDGTRATLASNFDFCTRSGAWNGDNLPSLTLVNQLAILAITLKNADGSSDITSSITGLTLSDGTNTYTVSRAAAAGPIYVAIRPTSDATITVTATDGTKNYTKTLTSKTYEAGNGYPVSWRMAPATPALNITSPSVGQVIGSDGKNYPAASVPSGVTKVAMIAYVSGSNGLAIALADESGSMNWATAKSTCEAKTPAFTGGTWKLPSLDEWKNMLTYDGDSYWNNNLQTALSTAGGNSLQEWMYYWSSTDYVSDNTQACDVEFMSGYANFSNEYKTYTSGMLVRAVLAF